MDIVKQLLADQTGPLVEKLTSQLGFSAEQAQGFVPAAVGQLIEAVKGGGIDLANPNMPEILASLKEEITGRGWPEFLYYGPDEPRDACAVLGKGDHRQLRQDQVQ